MEFTDVDGAIWPHFPAFAVHFSLLELTNVDGSVFLDELAMSVWLFAEPLALIDRAIFIGMSWSRFSVLIVIFSALYAEHQCSLERITLNRSIRYNIKKYNSTVDLQSHEVVLWEAPVSR